MITRQQCSSTLQTCSQLSLLCGSRQACRSHSEMRAMNLPEGSRLPAGTLVRWLVGREPTPGGRDGRHSEPALARRSGSAGSFDLPRICHFILGFSFLAQPAELGKDIFFFFSNQLRLPWMKARLGPKEILFHFRIKIPFTEK